MAKSTAQKLLIKPQATLWVSDPTRVPLLGDLPPGARVVDRPADASTVVLFVDSAAAARAQLDAHHAALVRADMLWIAYPKGGRADINRDTLWPIVADYGMRPISQVAVDEVWSALRFRPLRAPSDDTRALRALVRGRDDLVAQRVALANQLRALLERTLGIDRRRVLPPFARRTLARRMKGRPPVRDPKHRVAFFHDMLGMEISHQEGGSVYMRAYEDFYQYTLKVTEAKQAGLEEVTWRASSARTRARRSTPTATSSACARRRRPSWRARTT